MNVSFLCTTTHSQLMFVINECAVRPSDADLSIYVASPYSKEWHWMRMRERERIPWIYLYDCVACECESLFVDAVVTLNEQKKKHHKNRRFLWYGGDCTGMEIYIQANTMKNILRKVGEKNHNKESERTKNKSCICSAQR